MKQKALHGMIRVRITSADIPGALRTLTEHSIVLQDIASESDLSVFLTLSRTDLKKGRTLLEKRGDSIEPKRKFGLYWTILSMKKRWVLLIGCLFLLVLTFYIPSKIYFFEVKGNHSISEKWILENAELSGLSFGCKRAEIKSEQIKNNILERVPELDWIGITTAGCVATIEVREKPIEEKIQNPSLYVSHIVANCDGVVESVTVTKGTPLCKPGQAVEKGQILISGYEDCGLIIKATSAEGEVFGKTIRTINLFTPANGVLRGEKSTSTKKYSIQIGKKLINFSKDSGISPPGCVKMYLRKYLTLPGGFQLPVSLICQELIPCVTLDEEPIELNAEWLEHTAQQYVLDQMIAGEILLQQTVVKQSDDFRVLTGVYACREQIGKTKFEEFLNHNG